DTHTLPYAALLNLPGFKSMRVPTRFYVMVITGTAILSAYGMQSFTARFQQKPRVYNVALMTLVLLLFLENVPMNNPGAEGNPLKAITTPREMRRMQGVYRPQDAAEVPAYAWLREQPPGTPIVHYPGSYFIVQNMLADQHLHGQPIFTGGGTFYPDYYWAIRWEIFPDMYVMHLLWQRDIRYLLVHRDLMNPDELSAFEARLAVFEREWIDLPYVGRFGEIDIYEVTAPEQIVIDFDDKTPVGEGWHTPHVDEQNRTFIWTGPEARSSLNLEPIPLSTDYRILVVVLDEGLEGLAYSMSIFVNGITIPLLRESNSETAYSGVIPGAALDSEIFQLDFAVPAVSADGRGLALDWLIIAPQPGIK
ncbi:MAG TPA: hypothetical protein VJZ27_05360, partial [Aggregatilineales bacterium]|nr:hypothetical protein [Aggregatilineales bacterium]